MHVDPLVRRRGPSASTAWPPTPASRSGRWRPRSRSSAARSRACTPSQCTPRSRSPAGHRVASSLQPVGVEPALRRTPARAPSAVDPVVLEPVAELVLAVAGLQRRSASGAFATRSTASSCSSTSACSAPASMLAVGQQRELVPHAGDPLAQRGGGPDGRRGRVVQLVGQARRSARRAPAAAPAAPTRPARFAHAEEQALEQVHRHREPARITGANSAAGSAKNALVGDRAHRRRCSGCGCRRSPKYAGSRPRRRRAAWCGSVSTSSPPDPPAQRMVPESST